MTELFAVIASAHSVAFTTADGKTITLNSHENSSFDDIKQLLSLAFRLATKMPEKTHDTKFHVGHFVKCVDGTGLGATDISVGQIYVVDEIKKNKDNEFLFIGPKQGIGRYYDSKRFELADMHQTQLADEAFEPQFDQNNSSLEYNRGYDSGYAKGLSDAEDPNVEYVLLTEDHSDDPYSNGFVQGWNAGMQVRRPVSLEPQKGVSEASVTKANTDTTSNQEAAQEALKSFAEPDVKIGVAKPLHDTPVFSLIKFDPKTGSFGIS